MGKAIFEAGKYLPGNKVELLTGGDPYFSRLFQLIGEARQQIQFQVYIFDEDETGREVAEALIAASKRGVEIFLAVDSYGSKSLSPGFIARLKDHGIRFKLYSPLPEHFYVFRLGRRLHNKVVVADHAVALVGGINIANKYRGSATEPPWLDFALAIEGPVCADLSRVCQRIFWNKYFGKLKSQPVVSRQRLPGAVHSRLALNDWFRRKIQIGEGYRSAFWNARHSIIIVASYFLPSRSIRRALKTAVRNGVQVAVLLPGVSDLPMAKRATRYLYHWLLSNNIKIYEWDDSILHGKMAVVDQQWTTVGSYNLNHLSHYSSIEMNIEVLDKAFSTEAHQYLSQLLQQAHAVTTSGDHHGSNHPNRLLDWGAYTLARWIMLFLFFLVRREHKYKEKE